MKQKKVKANTPTLSTRNGKNTNILNETQIFFEYLKHHRATCSMVCRATGIKQKCATRYKRDLEKLNLLWVIDHKRCEVTGYMASWITTNPELVKYTLNIQLSLFKGGES